MFGAHHLELGALRFISIQQVKHFLSAKAGGTDPQDIR